MSIVTVLQFYQSNSQVTQPRFSQILFLTLYHYEVGAFLIDTEKIYIFEPSNDKKIYNEIVG